MAQNPKVENGATTRDKDEKQKPKVVVVMGPTGSGKSKLAVDLANHFPIQIINADSMQVYRGLDVITNKLPLADQNGVPHHLLGTINPNVEFSAKEFRDLAIPIIDEIVSQNCVPVIVGGTNYYIQALVSPFLLDDTAKDLDENMLNEEEESCDDLPYSVREGFGYSYDCLKELDPIAANRVHPNNHRKITQYLSLYARYGILPSKLYQGMAGENWGHIDNCRFDCCFVCIDAAGPLLDRHVEQRVDSMIDSGLLSEVSDIYSPNADYSRGLRQAIGVREFEDFLRVYSVENMDDRANDAVGESLNSNINNKMPNDKLRWILYSSDDSHLKRQLLEAIDRVKSNTRRLVRVQRRRISRLGTLFGWKVHHIDATESISSKSDEVWATQVVEPAAEIVRSFLSVDGTSMHDVGAGNDTGTKLIKRNLWTQYICEACGNRVLRGSHEWEQHRKGRGHRKRMSTLKKSQVRSFTETQ